MILATLALLLAGLAALALSMHKHHRDLLGTAPRRGRVLLLRGAGWALLGLSAAACIAGQGVSVGIVFWFGTLTVAALAVAAALTWRTRRRSSRA